MKLTPEQMEYEIAKFHEEMKQKRISNKLQKIYRENTMNNQLDLNIHWFDISSDIDKDFLRSRLTTTDIYRFEEVFKIEYFDLDSILKFIFKTVTEVNRIFPKTQLWDTDRNDGKMTNLISYIIEGDLLCPPYIDFLVCDMTNAEIFTIVDGNHRIALCRYLGLKRIPFIIRIENEDRIKKGIS